MSMDYWICAGLGVTEEEVFEFLDPEKIRQFISENPEPFEGGFGDVDLSKDPEYIKAGNHDKLDILSCYANLSVAYILSAADASQEMIGSSNGEGKHFLLCPPRYSWESKESDSKSEDEARERIVNLLMRFALEDTERATFEELIDYHHELGCG